MKNYTLRTYLGSVRPNSDRARARTGSYRLGSARFGSVRAGPARPFLARPFHARHVVGQLGLESAFATQPGMTQGSFHDLLRICAFFMCFDMFFLDFPEVKNSSSRR